MKKKISEIVIIAVVSFSALIFTTGCGFCYSCGRTAGQGCQTSCVNGCKSCIGCYKCSGCENCTTGCVYGCLGK